MFVIRNAQMKQMAKLRTDRFVKQRAAHLRKYFPEWAHAFDELELEAFVRTGMARAESYGLRTELEVARYLEAMQALGQDFDRSAEHPWAAELLTRNLSSTEKTERLQDAVFYQLEARRLANGR